MDSPIRGPMRGGAYDPHYLPRPSRDGEGEPRKPFTLEDAEAEIVLEPQPRKTSGEAAVSREHLEDEAGQIIDLRG